ncbi:MAG: hypothetical protein LBB90_08885 [Tannerella sp.]|jgi:hypothetical protein|nr:hypothetical protein [Tannerella sp.]
MIIPNGTICAKVETGGGLDANGNPVKPVSDWGFQILAYIKTNRYSELGVSDGNSFRIASYEVLIDEQPFRASHVKLATKDRILGEFPVMQIEKMSAVGAVKILV